jgi:hypothetical protein
MVEHTTVAAAMEGKRLRDSPEPEVLPGTALMLAPVVAAVGLASELMMELYGCSVPAVEQVVPTRAVTRDTIWGEAVAVVAVFCSYLDVHLTFKVL